MDDIEDQNYEGNYSTIKTTGAYLRYMEKQKEIKEMNQTKQPPWLINNILFCYEEETHMGNDNVKKQHFLQLKGKYSNNKEVYTDRSKSTGRKVGIAAVFENIT